MKKKLGYLVFVCLLSLLTIQTQAAGPENEIPPLRPEIRAAARHDTSPPMRDLVAPTETTITAPVGAGPGGGIVSERRILPKAQLSPAEAKGDPVVQRTLIPGSMPLPQQSFEGIGNISGVAPPDTQGDIGYDPATGRKYYVQWVNLDWGVWDVTTPTEAALIYGPADGNAIWTGFGGPCETMNDGDPITLFDPFAHRWLMTQFAVSAEPYYECIAVSATADPTGSWHRYAFEVSPDKMNDYPKFGVWPDAYYMTANQFLHGGSWAGAGVFAFERERMLRGEPANMIAFDLANVNINFGGMLPTDFDGAQPPPAGAPNYFIEVDDSAWLGDAQDTMRLWAFHVDWETPGNSTFGLNGLPNQKLPVANYDPLCVETWECIPQKSSPQRVDAIGERLMHRAAYRNFGSHEAIVVNQTVDVGGQRAGVRWYEVRKSDDAWAIHQQGTFAPDDGLHRWMASIAQDHVGNTALGYSISGPTMDPAIHTTGRLANDPLGEMTQGEAVFFPGQTAQSGVNRWGDYSMMGIDPVDDCTFWYTQMYSKGGSNWATRIGSFQFPDCTLGGRGKLQGAVTDAANGDPIAEARVAADRGNQQPYETLTDAAGDYALALPAGSYTVTAHAYGYAAAITNLTVTSDSTTTHDFVLTPVGAYVVSGTVTDLNTGMPLYAHLSIRGEPDDPPAARAEVWTDPQTGAYSTTLATGLTHTIQVASWAAGYLPTSTQIAPLTGNTTLNLTLDVDADQCEAPGYRFDYTGYAYIEGFEADPGGYTVTGELPSWAYGTPINGPGDAHSGQHAWATNLSGNYQNDEESYLTSPPLDLSAYAGQGFALSWWQWAATEENYDYLSVEASQDGGETWATIYDPISGKYDAAWTKRQVILDASYAITDVRLRFHLDSDTSTSAPGWYIDDVGLLPVTIPQEITILTEDFEADGGGYTTTMQAGTENISWEHGVPTNGPVSAHAGSNVWATNLDGDYLNEEKSYLLSPTFDLSAHADQEIIVSWWQWAVTESGYDKISVQVSVDDGATWSTVYGPRDGAIATEWTQERVNLGIGYGTGAFQVRFFMDSDISVTAPGWYIDDVEINAVDPLEAPPTPCEAQAGGLVFGHLYDQNTGAPLIGAEVRDATGERSSAHATADPGRDDAFYQHVLLTGMQTLTATMTGGYAPISATITVTNYETQQRDFYLPAGRLAELNPAAGRETTLLVDEQAVLTGALVNTGTRAASYEIWEFDAPPPDLTPVTAFLHRGRHTSPKKLNVPTLRGERYTRYPPAAPRYPTGEVVTMATGLDGAWGIAHHTLSDTLWIGNTAPAGDGLLYEFEKDGARTHRTISTTAWTADFAADLAFNPLTQKLWQVNVGGDNCIYEMDPTTSAPTGRTICPPVGNSQRGLAYDPLSDTYVSGAWTDSLIHRFTPEGTIVAEKDLGVAIAGLAYNPLSGHLFVVANGDAGSDVYVFNVRDDYALLGGFDVPGLGAFEQSGLTLDCDGTLWAVNQDTDVVIGIASGEMDVCAWRGIPWLDIAPDQGALTASARQPLTYTYDATGMQPGRYLAHLRLPNDTPYGSLTLPVTFTVQAPATWSTISGTIRSRGYCDRHPAPLADAALRLAGADGYTATTTSDSVGRYRYALDATHGPLTVSVTAAGHQPLTRAGVALTAQQTTTLDLGLRLTAPCATITPTAITAEIDPTGGAPAIHTETLSLHNDGTLSYTFDITKLLVLQQQHEVLLLSPDSSAGDISGLVAALTAYDDVAVTIWDNAQGEPHAADLTPYDVVILGNNYTWGPDLDATVIGDAVADYIDAGGKVIESLYVQSYDAWGFDGRYIFEHYSPFTRATADYVDADAMQIAAPTHPVMRHVSDITDVSGHQDPAARAGAEVLASWAGTGRPAVAVNDNVVALNLMIFHQPGWQGDVPILLHNAIMWLTGAATQEVAWLTAAPTEGSVAADGQTAVTVTLTPRAEMGAGNHTAYLIIATDDERTPQITVPVTLTIACLPIAGADFTHRPDVPLLGETVTFTGGVSSGSEPITYTWNFGDGSPIAEGQVVTHTFPETMTLTMTTWQFPVLMTAQNACSAQHVQKTVGLTPWRRIYLPLLMRQGE